MTSDGRPDADRDAAWMLRGLLERVPRTRAPMLASSDGLRKAAEGTKGGTADHLAVAASILVSIVGGAGAPFGVPGVSGNWSPNWATLLLFVSPAGPGSALTVVAGRDTDAGVFGNEISRFVTGTSTIGGTAASGVGADHEDQGG